MSSDPLNITVSVSPGGLLIISDPVAFVPKDSTRTLTWIPQSPEALTIKFIGFYNPTDDDGAVSPITTPKPSGQGDGSWTSTANNTYTHQYADRFFYTVYAEWNGKMLSSDPEIEVEGKPPGG
jgi:hypothetical protein